MLFVIFGGTGLVGPWMLSYSVERQFSQSMKNMSSPGSYSFDIVSYKRGWFNSTARTALTFEGEWAEALVNSGTITEPDNKQVVLYLNHAIDHGPFIFNDQVITVALAQASTTANLPPEFVLLKVVLRDGQPIMNFHTVFGFTGGSATTFDSPGYNGPLLTGAVLSYSGFNGKIVQDSTFVTIVAKLPQLAYQSSQGSVSIEDIAFTGDYELLPGIDWLGFGPTGFTIRSIGVKRPATHTSTGQSLEITLNEFEISSNAIKQGDSYDFTIAIGVNSGVGTDIALGQNQIDISVNNFPQKSLDLLYDQWTGLREELRLQTNQPEDLAKLIEPVVNALFQEGLTGSYDLNLNIAAGDDRIVVNSKLSFDSYAQGINAKFNIDIEDIALPDIDLKESNIQFSLTGLNTMGLRKAYIDVIRIRASAMPVWQQEMEIAASFDDLLSNMITPNSTFLLENLALKTDYGVLVGTGKLGIAGTTSINWGRKSLWFDRLRGEASVRISEHLLHKVLAGRKTGGIRQNIASSNPAKPIDEAIVEGLAEKLAQSTIRGYEAQSVLQRDGDMFVVEIDLQNGRMLINGIDQTSLLTQTD